jgi:spore coat polysaccharide biosynthesis protein SpsF
MKFVAVIQARIGSSRLPGKVMYPLNGRPALVQEIERTAAVSGLDRERVVVATSDASRDDVVARVASDAGASVFRGSETDVLRRIAGAVSAEGADAAVRVCGDNALIAPALLEGLRGRLADKDNEYVTSRFEHTFPVGHNADAFTRETIQQAVDDAETSAHREHLGKYFAERRDHYRWENVVASDVFEQEFLDGIPMFNMLRVTMDYPEDYELLSRLYREVQYEEVLDTRAAIRYILDADLRGINAQYEEGMWPTDSGSTG